MNDNSINQKIAGLIESAKKNYLVNYDFTKDYSFSQQCPEGPKAYFIKKRIELANQIEHESMFGHAWARFLCNSDILNSDWIYKCTKLCLDHFDKNVVWNKLERFLDQFVLWLRYTDFIENCEQNPDDREPIIKREYVSLTRSRAFCIMIMFQNDKITLDIIASKKKLIERTEKEFPEQSGKTVYEALKTGEMIYYNFEDQKIKYILDYDYGLKLYKEKYPD